MAHFDLYRLEGQPPGEEFHECLDEPGTLVIAEWAQYLPPAHRPAEALFLSLRPVDTGREARLAAMGPAAQALLDALVADRA